DCTLLGSGQDLIYFTGNWADYSKVISGSVLTFSRTVDGYNESVKVVGSTANNSLNDRLVFADGAVYSGNAKTALSASLTTAINAVTGYDATLVTPLSRDTVAPTLVISDDGGSASGVYNYSFTFSEAVSGFAASDIAVVNGSTGAFTTIDASHYNLLVTPTSSTTPLDLTVNVGAGAATDLAGNANTAAVQVLHSVLYGSAGADTLTVGAALDAVFLGAGADVLKVTQAGNATTALTDRVFDFSATDKLDLTGLLGSGGSGYASVLQDSGAGFVELKNLSLLKDVANNQTNVSFDVSFDTATIGGSKISAAVIDLSYQYASVVGGVAISPTFASGASGAVWQVIQTNLSPADSSNPNGKIALLAAQDAANPIITTGNAATGAVLTVNLILNGLTNTFAVGLESQAGGGGTSVMTANGQAYGVETGITKIAGAAAGGTGVLEIVTDTGVLGTVGDNQLHMLTRFDGANNLTHLQLAYDTNPGAGATTASNVIAMDFLGDVTANLIPSHINYL
ncbi:MAG: Ig-like domain-containing protein, partial [Betaproteobacteria bacterium]